MGDRTMLINFFQDVLDLRLFLCGLDLHRKHFIRPIIGSTPIYNTICTTAKSGQTRVFAYFERILLLGFLFRENKRFSEFRNNSSSQR